jgi:diacylglycerol kinase family enzyme
VQRATDHSPVPLTDGGAADRDGGSVGSDGGRKRRVVLNPASGSGDHAPRVRELAAERGYTVVETGREGHAIELARAAAEEGVTRLAACGGDGTLREVAEGLVAADALGAVRLGVLPAGTANVFAGDVGIRDVEHGFELLEAGEVRDIDLGMADDEPFVKSCVAGLTAVTSAATTPDMKARFGPLAFVITGVQQAASFEGLRLDVEAVGGERTEDETAGDRDDGTEALAWSGEALCVLVGNARRFARELGQANVEDGLFDVTLIERTPASDAVAEAIAQQLLGRDTEHVTRQKARRLRIVGRGDGPIDFSLDGEIRSHDRLDLRVHPDPLRVCVGPDYEPEPTVE